MERRQLFPSLFGLITGAAAAVSPKPPPAPAPPEPVVEASEGEKSRATHTDLSVLIADVRRWVDAHPGAAVLPHDLPQYRLLGFVAFIVEGDVETSSFYSIPLTSLAKTCHGVVNHGLLRTPDGRREFCKDLARGTV